MKRNAIVLIAFTAFMMYINFAQKALAEDAPTAKVKSKGPFICRCSQAEGFMGHAPYQMELTITDMGTDNSYYGGTFSIRRWGRVDWKASTNACLEAIALQAVCTKQFE